MPISRILAVDDDPEILASYQSVFANNKNTNALDDLANQLFDMDFPEKDKDSFEEFSEGVVIDDDLDISGFEITLASQGQEAIHKVRQALEANNPFHVIFLDMRMPPGINGKDTAYVIRQIDPLVEIIIMTAYSDYSVEEIVQDIGTSSNFQYFRKPFDPDHIIQLAISSTKRWHLDQKNAQHDIH
ncbi:MAG: response regulator [SAR324 cluster bacterium]|nr:response regulator [SAR324 cluster bacterium]